MYYHNSPTTQKIKQLKAQRAAIMKKHIDAMAATSKLYEPLIKQLNDLRAKELQIDSILSRNSLSDDQLQAINGKLEKLRHDIYSKIDKLL